MTNGPNISDAYRFFAAALQQECGRILASRTFARSPIQTKLLAYLCEEASRGGGKVDQYQIAVDALGRQNEYDADSDSYARVHMSRLRANLTSYYARQEVPSEECVYIKTGEYRLRLAAKEVAYPELTHPSKVYEITEPENAKQAIEPTSSTGILGQINFEICVLVALFFLIIGFSLAYHTVNPTQAREPNNPARVAFQISSDGYFSKNDKNRQLSNNIERDIRSQITSAYLVAFELKPASEQPKLKPDYTLIANLGNGVRNPEVSLTLIDQNGVGLFHSNIQFSGNRDKLFRDINAKVGRLVGPDGLIPKREAARISGSPSSAYECAALIEFERGEGMEFGELLDQCIERFPDRRYLSYWLTRKGLAGYLIDASKGVEPSSQNENWDYIAEALSIDEYNPYANFVAAKVNIAEGKCGQAKQYLNRARDRSKSYPTLVAATFAEGSGCLASNEISRAQARTEIAAMIETHPVPSPALRINLLLAALTNGFGELASDAANLPVMPVDGDDQTLKDAQDFTGMLQKANDDLSYFKANHDAIEQRLSVFIWNEQAREQVHETLSK